MQYISDSCGLCFPSIHQHVASMWMPGKYCLLLSERSLNRLAFFLQ